MNKIIVLLVLIVLSFSAGCANKARTGAGVGALTGATVGALTAGNKVEGAAIGAGIGLLAGYIVGNEWDKYDAKQVSHTLENTPSGQTTTWKNPDTGKTYSATPQPAYQQNNRVCRDVTITTDSGEKVKARACRGNDGYWRLEK